jgi:hypothetical protein
MGLMEDLGAWLDQKKKNAANAGREIAAQAVDSPTGAATDYARGSAAGVGDMLDMFHKGMYPATSDLGAGPTLRGLLGNTGSATEEAGGLFGFPGAGTAAKFTAKGLLPMAAWTAYHGSPHKFDKFDLSKIGTGEGAQAYGHGLYFADAPEVAKSYADALGPQGAFSVIDDFLSRNAGRKMSTADVRKSLESRVSIEALAKDDAAVDAIRRLLPTYKPSEAVTDEALRHYRVVNDAVERTYKPSTYKVDISDAKAPQDAFLQWDKPLSEQPKAVRDVARQFNGGKDPRPSMTGEELLRYIERQRRFTGSGKAEDALREAGIPGIRYLDGGSRGAGSGTMNTVLFDDSLVKILERNGQPLGLLGR